MSPFKSEAQRQSFIEKLKRGEITQEEFDEWEKDTPTDIPQRVPQGYPKWEWPEGWDKTK